MYLQGRCVRRPADGLMSNGAVLTSPSLNLYGISRTAYAVAQVGECSLELSTFLGVEFRGLIVAVAAVHLMIEP